MGDSSPSFAEPALFLTDSEHGRPSSLEEEEHVGLI